MQINEQVRDSADALASAQPGVQQRLPETDSARVPPSAIAVAAVAPPLLSACGGGGSDSGSPGGATSGPGPVQAAPVDDAGAARFLMQAAMGITREQIDAVKKLGFAGWLDAQFALAPSTPRWEWLVGAGWHDPANRNGENGIDAAMWRKLIASPDTLRQRVTLALSEILVVSVSSLEGGGWKSFSAAAYLDLLEANAFGNYRTLLQQVSQSAPMGEYLTFRNNPKANPKTGALPDENYARELMQLFTIGLVQLNPDGTPRLKDGAPVETYALDDITGLARVFTGWGYDLAGGDTSTPDFKRRPMINNPGQHEGGVKTFLGTSIAAGTGAQESLTRALDALFAHPNVAPFVSRQLIQRLVTSNPAPDYVQRVAAVFENDGAGSRGNLRAVVKAILLDKAARSAPALDSGSAGKLREPILRFTAWARAFNARSPLELWNIGNTSDPASRLGQSPLRAPSVFNFFRPGYTPSNSALGSSGLVAPEFQIANESTVIGYLNFMQAAVSRGVGDVKADYALLLALGDGAQALIDEVNLLLCAGQLTPATQSLIKGALEGMPATNEAQRLSRIHACLVLTMASPEFIVQK